jgi:hypothetical protein
MTLTHLYGFTVQGIQSYIFQTNNLREIIGASEIVEAVCDDWFESFLAETKPNIEGIKLQNAAGNIKFMTTEENAKRIFKEYGEIINQKAPGLPFSQAIASDLESLEKALTAQRNIPQFENDIGHMSRMVARVTGDLTISMEIEEKTKKGFDNYKKKRNFIDNISFQKFRMSFDAKDRLCNKAGVKEEWLVQDFEEMAKDGKHSWLALIHIDGNGLGNHIKSISEKHKNNPLQKSKEISEFAGKFADCTNEAFKVSFERTFAAYFKTNGKTPDKSSIPFRPLILGGDDVTVILRADYAIQFVDIFLKEFEKKTLQKELKTNAITNLAESFTACAGIAFVKAKFPFHYTAHLAEELCAYAKGASGRTKSALLFHKVSDSFISDYGELIDKELMIHKGKSNEQRISKEFYGLKELSDLIQNIEKIGNEKGMKNAMRQWMDLTLNDSPEAKILNERANKKYGDLWKNLKVEHFADHLTLLAVS